MILFFGNQLNKTYAVQVTKTLKSEDVNKLNWLFGDANQINKTVLSGYFIGPRASMVTPWSTNASLRTDI